jgi:hypothetical protein
MNYTIQTSASGIEKGKWLEWRDVPSRTDSSGSNGPVEPDLVLDAEESFIIGRLVSALTNYIGSPGPTVTLHP